MTESDVRATTILAVRRNGVVALGGDGQVTMAVADAFTLFEKLEEKLERYPANLMRACVEMAKEWRTDRFLRRLEALLVVADAEHLFLIGGDGNVIEPDDEIAAIGSGGSYALAAARALRSHSELGAVELVREALSIAGEICVYTNTDITVLELE